MEIKGKSYLYHEFLELVDTCVAEGRTTGNNQSEALIGFTALNQKRMSRLNKTLQLTPETQATIEGNAEKQHWYVITEAWCGDSAQNLPVLAKLAAANKNITLKIVLRDEHPDIIQKYHTNGSHSIPKLVVFNNNEECFTWGPRPAEAQAFVLDWKANPNGKSWHDFETELHLWYTKNKGVEVQNEMIALLEKCMIPSS